MAKRVQKTFVSVTPGQNEKVNNVIKFEDLLKNVRQGAALPPRRLAALPAQQREQLGSIQQLAADLERRLRAVRAAMPDQAKPAPARRTSRRKGKS